MNPTSGAGPPTARTCGADWSVCRAVSLVVALADGGSQLPTQRFPRLHHDFGHLHIRAFTRQAQTVGQQLPKLPGIQVTLPPQSLERGQHVNE
jgi:hypothetical protein